MREKVEGTWADDTTVLAEIELAADGDTYTLVVFDAHHEEYAGMPSRTERRVILEKGTHVMCDYSVQEPIHTRRMPNTYRFVEEVTTEVDDLTYALAIWTDSFGYDDPTESITRRLGLIVRKGEHDHWMHEFSVGYVREVEYVPPPRPPKPPIVWPEQAEAEEALYCPDCDRYFDLDSAIALYECSRCGQATAERRCEQCNIFTAKLSDEGCPECESAELEQAQAVRDVSGNLHSTEEPM